jgi:hypothetical protein
MATVHSYTTLVRDIELDQTVEVATISLDALADRDLADAIAAGKFDEAAAVIHDLVHHEAGTTLDVRLVDEIVTASADDFVRRLAAVLPTGSIDDAERAWRQPTEADHPLVHLVGELLSATVLIEQSDAAAITAAGAVGTAVVGAQGAVLVAVIHAGAVSGGLVLLVSPVGLVAVGVGSFYLTYRLIRRRRG